MKTAYSLVSSILILLVAISQTGYTQSQSDFALIKQPVFTDPLTWKLTASITNQHWNVDLFSFSRSTALSYIASPSYEVFSGVNFTIDEAWNRIIYIEGLDNWIREHGSYGQGQGQVWWPRSIESLAP